MNGLVVAVLGTDHHPFDRLVDWVDTVAEDHPQYRFLVQYGASKPPRVADGRAHLPHEELLRLVAAARAVVCHGGPSTIADARSLGHTPVCVPRDPVLGEHVDDHQQRFAALVSSSGLVRQATELASLRALVGTALAETVPALHTALPEDDGVYTARSRLAKELDILLDGTGRRPRRPRWRQARQS